MNTLLMHELPTLVGLLVKTTLFLLAALAVSLCVRRASAATRHLIWTAALAGVLLLPLLSVCTPSWNVRYARATAVSSPPLLAPPVAVQAPPPSDPLDLRPVVGPPPAEAALRGAAAPSVAVVVPAKAMNEHRAACPLPSAATFLAAGLLAWLVGSLLVLFHLVVGLRRVGRLGRQAVALEGQDALVAEAARQQIGLRRLVEFQRATRGSGVVVPVTWGVLRPVVLLPPQSSAWSEDCLRAALLHELAHVQRGDWGTQLMGRLACALYWWHPLVWRAARQGREESERACDDLVLGTGMKAADYAQRLVEVVRSMPAGAPVRMVAIAMAEPSEVVGRVQAVLAQGNSRRPLTIKWMIGSFALVLLLAVPVATLRLMPAAQAQGVPAAGPRSAAGAASSMVTVADGHVNIVNGDRAVFPNGYEVSLVAVTRAVRTGDEWDMFGGPWWRPDGTFIAPQSGGLDGHWHWSTAHTRGLPPFVFKVAFRAPALVWKHGDSSSPGFYEQFLGALKPDDQGFEGHIVISGPHPTVRDITSPLVDGSAPQRLDGAVGGTRFAEIYPTGTHACTVRCGVAAGPWQTVSRLPSALTPSSVTTEAFVPSLWSSTAQDFTDVALTLDDRPRETYLDARGKRHVFYFLGAAGRLGNVARRFVAVDRAGRVIPLNEVGTQRVALAFGSQSDVTKWNPTLNLANVKEFRLQTCPYLTVEFRNVQLQPALTAGSVQDATTLLAQASTQQLEQARQLRSHLQEWAQAKRSLLQSMVQARPDDLTALMSVYESLQRLPFPLWPGDPRLGNGTEDAPFAIELPSRLTLPHLQRSQELMETRMRRDFAEDRDLAVAQSVNVGPAHLTLWASGRVTRTTARDQFMGHGTLVRIGSSEQQEIMPAFFPASFRPLPGAETGNAQPQIEPAAGTASTGQRGTGVAVGNADFQKRLDKELPKLKALAAFAKDRDATLSQLALSWLLHQPMMASPIIGATSADQVRENAKSVELKLSVDDLARINSILTAPETA